VKKIKSKSQYLNKEKENSDLAETLRYLYEKFNHCYEASYRGSSYEERDEYRQIIKSTKELILKAESNKPETHALIAYMILKASRLRAIINNVAKNPDLKNQNRTLWDKRMIEEGIMYLEKSAGGHRVTEYHLRAGICACHSLAKDYGSTDWKKILSLYDQYLEINNSIEIALERSRVISDIEGPKAAIDAVLRIDTQNNPSKSKELNLILAELYIKLREYEEAVDCLSKCLELTNNDKEKSTYLSNIELCKQQLELTKKYNLVLSF
jgi:predicted RNA polymerase sigma factor